MAVSRAFSSKKAIYIFYGHLGTRDRATAGKVPKWPSGKELDQSNELVAQTMQMSLRSRYPASTHDIYVVQAWTKDIIIGTLAKEGAGRIAQVHILTHGDSEMLSLAWSYNQGARLQARVAKFNALAGGKTSDAELAKRAMRASDSLIAGYFTYAIDPLTKKTLRANHASGASWQIWGCFAGNPKAKFRGVNRAGYADINTFLRRYNKAGGGSLPGVAVDIAKNLGVTVTAATGRGGLHYYWDPSGKGSNIHHSNSRKPKRPHWLWLDHNTKWVTYESDGSKRAGVLIFGAARSVSALPDDKLPTWYSGMYYKAKRAKVAPAKASRPGAPKTSGGGTSTTPRPATGSPVRLPKGGVVKAQTTRPAPPKKAIYIFYGYLGTGDRSKSSTDPSFPNGKERDQSNELAARTLRASLRVDFRGHDIYVIQAWRKNVIIDRLAAETKGRIEQVHVFTHGDSEMLSLAYGFPRRNYTALINRATKFNALLKTGKLTTREVARRALRDEDALVAGYLSYGIDAKIKAKIKANHASGASWQIWGCYAGGSSASFGGLGAGSGWGAAELAQVNPYLKRFNASPPAGASLDGISVEIAKNFGVKVTAARSGSGLHYYWDPDGLRGDGSKIAHSNKRKATAPQWLWLAKGAQWVSFQSSGTQRSKVWMLGKDRAAADLPNTRLPKWLWGLFYKARKLGLAKTLSRSRRAGSRRGLAYANKTKAAPVAKTIYIFVGHLGSGGYSVKQGVYRWLTGISNSAAYPGGADKDQSNHDVAKTLKKQLEVLFPVDTIKIVQAWSKEVIINTLSGSEEGELRQVHILSHGDSDGLYLAYRYYDGAEGLLVERKAAEFWRDEASISGFKSTKSALKTQLEATDYEPASSIIKDIDAHLKTAGASTLGKAALQHESALMAGYLSTLSSAKLGTLKKKFYRPASGPKPEVVLWGCYAGYDTAHVGGFGLGSHTQRYSALFNQGQAQGTRDGIAVEIASKLEVRTTAAKGRGGLSYFIRKGGKVVKENVRASQTPMWLWLDNAAGTEWVTRDPTSSGAKIVTPVVLFQRVWADVGNSGVPRWMEGLYDNNPAVYGSLTVATRLISEGFSLTSSFAVGQTITAFYDDGDDVPYVFANSRAAAGDDPYYLPGSVDPPRDDVASTGPLAQGASLGDEELDDWLASMHSAEDHEDDDAPALGFGAVAAAPPASIGIGSQPAVVDDDDEDFKRRLLAIVERKKEAKGASEASETDEASESTSPVARASSAPTTDGGDPHAIFERIGRNMAEATTFDLGKHNLARRNIEAFSRDIMAEGEGEARPVVAAAPVAREPEPDSTALTDMDVVSSLALIRAQATSGAGSARVIDTTATPTATPTATALATQAKKLPRRSGKQVVQAWESQAVIAPRKASDCAKGIENLGTILFVHDAEKKIDLYDYGYYSNADSWVLVHTVSDLIDGLRAHVGKCGCVTGIMVDSHGGYAGSGGFRLGDDDDGDGHVESNEANDMVSTAAQAAKFGAIIKGALCTGGNAFVSIAACGSSGTNNAFLTALQTATGATTIGAPGSVRTGGNWYHRAWWESDQGRTQVNSAGTVKTSASKKGRGIWRPF